MTARVDRSPLVLTAAMAAALRVVATTQLLDAAGVKRECGDASAALEDLCRRGLVKSLPGTRRDGSTSTLFVVTSKGVTALGRHDARPAPVPAFEPKWNGQAYGCPELGRTCHRPGAYDAFTLPSLIGSERRMPRGAV